MSTPALDSDYIYMEAFSRWLLNKIKIKVDVLLECFFGIKPLDLACAEFVCFICFVFVVLCFVFRRLLLM